VGWRRARRSAGELDKEGRRVSHGETAWRLATQCLSGRHTFGIRTRVSLSFFLSGLFLSFALSLRRPFSLCLLLSISLLPHYYYYLYYYSLTLALTLPLALVILADHSGELSVFLAPSSCCLSALTSRTTSRHVARALPPLAGHGAAPIGASLPATTALQSAYGADR